MKQAKKVKVALVDLDGQVVPAWVRDTFEQADIELVVQECRALGELASCAADADIVWLFGGSPVLQDGNLDAVSPPKEICTSPEVTSITRIEIFRKSGTLGWPNAWATACLAARHRTTVTSRDSLLASIKVCSARLNTAVSQFASRGSRRAIATPTQGLKAASPTINPLEQASATFGKSAGRV